MQLGAQRAFYFTSLEARQLAFSMKLLVAMTNAQWDLAFFTKVKRPIATAHATPTQVAAFLLAFLHHFFEKDVASMLQTMKLAVHANRNAAFTFPPLATMLVVLTLVVGLEIGRRSSA